MKKKTRTSLILAALIAVLSCAFVFPAHRALADDGTLHCAVLGDLCKGVNTKDTKGDSKNQPVLGLLNMVLGIMTGLVGVAAVGAFVYAGITYASAGGKADQVAKAKTIMVNAVIGLIAFAIMGAVLQWLIPGGLF